MNLSVESHSGRRERRLFSVMLVILMLSAALWYSLRNPAVAEQAATEAAGGPAGEKAADPAIARIRAVLRRLYPEVPNFDVRAAAMPGMYEVSIDGSGVFYASKDGMHFIAGDLFQVRGNGLINLTEQNEARERRALIARVPKDEMIVYPAKQEQGIVTVFTDVECGYCRKFHQQVPELNAMGVTVQYLAWPRQGIASRGYSRLVTAWCSDDRAETLTRLKARKPVKDKTCENPVARHFELGRRVGVRGTPALVLENGNLLPGLVEAAELAPRAIAAMPR